MTTVYIPRPIRTVEDAEGLPEGTVAIQSWGHGTTARTLTNGRWITPSGSALPNAEVIGFTALVPVEAEEEWGRTTATHGHVLPIALRDGTAMWRARGYSIVTRRTLPWEAVEEA